MEADKPSVTVVACPTCRRAVEWLPENRYRPFCSGRCKLIDLGAWAEGKNAIACAEDEEGQGARTDERL